MVAVNYTFMKLNGEEKSKKKCGALLQMCIINRNLITQKLEVRS